MLINADFTRCATVASYQYQWIASPQAGVERVMLDRVGAEHARATSIVRYAADSHFPRHLHPGGEEILVLSGTCSDDDADYPAGWYLRNPPGSSHQPFSNEGAVIFVKLQQMPVNEQRRVRIDTRDPATWRCQGEHQVCPLFSDRNEQVYLQRFRPNDVLRIAPSGGIELLVLAGSMTAIGQSYEHGSWMRLPAGEHLDIVASALGVTVYLKTGHLADITVEV